MKYILIGIVKLYRLTLSRIKPPSCRFTPTCSAYAISALRRFGAVRGGYLTIRRIMRCHPWNPGGFDPVPEKFSFNPEKHKEE